MKYLSIFIVLILLLLLPFVGSPKIQAENTSPLFENLYLRVAPGDENGVIDFYYKDKNGNWKKYNSITALAKVGDSTNNAKTEKISFVAEQLTDGLASRVDLTKVKFQFAPLPNGAHFYLVMEMEQGKPYAKFTAFKNTDSADISEFSLAYINGLEGFTQQIKVNATTYDADKCSSFVPGCADIRTLVDSSTHQLNKPDNKIVTIVGEDGVKQLLFFDQDFATGDRLTAELKTKGASATKSLASPSAQRKEDPWFQTVALTRSPFNGDVNNWYFGVDVESTKGEVKAQPKEKRNLSFKIRFSGIEKNAGAKNVDIIVMNKKSKILEKKVNLVGTSSGVYVGTLENIPGNVLLQIYIKGPKHLRASFTLPIGVETVDWSNSALKGGDANNDNKVDSTDFALLQRDYLRNITSAADFNYDTRVDSQDFGILQEGYQQRSVKP